MASEQSPGQVRRYIVSKVPHPLPIAAPPQYIYPRNATFVPFREVGRGSVVESEKVSRKREASQFDLITASERYRRTQTTPKANDQIYR